MMLLPSKLRNLFGRKKKTDSRFGTEFRDHLNYLLRSSIAGIAQLYCDDLHQGACFVVYDTLFWEVLCSGEAGVILPDKVGKYYWLALEKMWRLNERHANSGHISGCQSKDESQEMFGGAIVAGRLVIAVSGLYPDPCDETVALLVAKHSDILSEKDANRIANISGNDYFRRFLR